MSVARANEAATRSGLSPRTQALWLAAMRHRRHADELAARDTQVVEP